MTKAYLVARVTGRPIHKFVIFSRPIIDQPPIKDAWGISYGRFRLGECWYEGLAQ